MPGTLRVHVGVDLGGVAEDLRSIELALGREVGRAIADAADTVLQAMPPFTPYDPQHRDTRKDGLPHLRDTFSAQRTSDTRAAVVSTHPGALVWEYGGTIHPRGVDIRIPEAAMARKAADAKAASFETALTSRVDALLARHGL